MNPAKVIFSVFSLSSLFGGVFAYNKLSNKNLTKNSTEIEKEKPEKQQKQVKKNKKYLIGYISDKATNVPQSGLINVENKNYLCKIENELINDCNIYKLNSSSDFDKPLDFQSIANDTKIVISYPEEENHKIKDDKKIEIYEKNKKSKLIFNINIENLNEQKQNIFSAQWIIAKIKSVNQSVKENGKSTFKCKVNNKETEIDCTIYKLSESNNLNAERKNPFFQYLDIDHTVEVKEDININDYVIISTNDTTLKTNNWKSNNQIIYVNNTPSNKESDKFLEIKYVADLGSANFIVRDEEMSYLIVSSEEITNSNDLTPALSKSNFECIIPISQNSSISDDSCQVYKMDQDDSSDTKKINFDLIFRNRQNQNAIPNLAANKNYVLKIKRKKLAKLMSGAKITIANQENNETKYFNLIKKEALVNEWKKLKTNILLVKVTESATANGLETTNNNYKCKFTSVQKNKQDCKVYSFNANQTIDNTNEIKVNQMQKLIQSNNANAAKDKYLMIEINGENNMFTEKELRSFIPQIYAMPTLESSESTTNLLKTEYVYSYVGNINSTQFNSSELFRIEPTLEDYLLVEYHSKPTTEASAELTENTNIKNYMCKFGTGENQLIDDTCELKIITSSTENNAIQNSQIETPDSSSIKKSHFAENKFFKLIINNPKFLKIAKQGTNITIASNKSGESNNYVNLKIVSKYFDEIMEIKTPLYLVKAKTPITRNQETLTSPKCRLNYEENDNLCSIYSFATDPNPTDKSNLDFSQASTSITKTSDIASEKYYVVKFTEGEHEIFNNFDGQQTLSLSENNNAITTFDLIAPIYAKNNMHTKGPVILLK